MNRTVKTLLLSAVVFTSNTSLADNNLSSKFLINELGRAHDVYLRGSPDVATYAMESLVRLLESDRSSELINETGPATLSFSYIRLGFLYEKRGLKQQAETAFSSAITSYKARHQASDNVVLSELKSYVNQLDKTAANR